jgi:hypothetical protein
MLAGGDAVEVEVVGQLDLLEDLANARGAGLIGAMLHGNA